MTERNLLCYLSFVVNQSASVTSIGLALSEKMSSETGFFIIEKYYSSSTLITYVMLITG